MKNYIDKDAVKALFENSSKHILEKDALCRVNSVPVEDVVKRSTFEQIKWERDVALSQLNEINKGLGEKMDNIKELISFANFVAKEIMREDFEDFAGGYAEIFCRKLNKLGIIQTDGEKWVYEYDEDE